MEQAGVRTRLDRSVSRPALVDPNQVRPALLNLLQLREALNVGGHIVMRVRTIGNETMIDVADDE